MNESGFSEESKFLRRGYNQPTHAAAKLIYAEGNEVGNGQQISKHYIRYILGFPKCIVSCCMCKVFVIFTYQKI